MNKKVIICLLLPAFLGSVIAPNFAFADRANPTGLSSEKVILYSAGIIAITIIVIYGIPLIIGKQKIEMNEKDTDPIIKTAKNNKLSPSGELIVFRW